MTSGAAVLEIKFTTRYFSKVYVGDIEHMAFYLHHFWRFISAMFVKHDVSLVVLKSPTEIIVGPLFDICHGPVFPLCERQ